MPRTDKRNEQMKDSDFVALTQKLLTAIVSGDFATYSSLCAADITCFEPESEGHLVQGLPFHKFYFDLPASHVPSDAPTTTVSMSGVHVRRLGDTAAVVSYVRLNQSYHKEEPKVTKACETRVWEKIVGEWKNVHMHRSTS